MTSQRGAIVAVLGVGLLAAGVFAGILALWPRTLHGIVTDGDAPVAGAVVRLRGAESFTLSGDDGRFTLRLRGLAVHQLLTAWKDGFYPAGADLSVNAPLLRLVPEAGAAAADTPEGIVLALKRHPTADDPSYQWITSLANPQATLGCAHCMTNYPQWQADAHSRSATNPRFLAMYNGAGANGAAAGPGFKLDFPDQAGTCANCHAPAAAANQPAGADINNLTAVEKEGVFCDFCHKIGGVNLDPGSGAPYQVMPGVQSYTLYRPISGTQIFFGTLDDIPRRVSYAALEKKSQFCAPCHSGGWWGVPAYASFDEWLASPYAQEGVECQTCHMKSDGKTKNTVSACAPATPLPLAGEAVCRVQGCLTCHLGGKDAAARDPKPDFSLIPDRAPQTISTHLMRGARDETLLSGGLVMTVTAAQGTDGVLVNVAITNVGAGHHVPTDSPMRNLILLVSARDEQGNTLRYLGSQTVPDWGGVGPVESGNYAGLPGKGFAKILADWTGESPAPQWREGVRIAGDTRIPARATDASHYAFALPDSSSKGAGKVTVEARLIYRNTFKAWAEQKGWELTDSVRARSKLAAQRVDKPVLAGIPNAPNHGLFAPSPATTSNGRLLAQGSVALPEQCGACHRQELSAWQASGHAAATTGPFYSAWDKAAAQTTQGQANPLCAGCHTPIGLLSGQIRSRWTWAGQQTAPLDAQAQSGVSCSVCHAITATTAAGNGAYVLDAALAAEPTPSGRHAPGYRSDLLDRPELCGACHDGTNPGGSMIVMSTFSEWRRSIFGGSDPAQRKTCQDCHFAAGQHGALRPADLRQAATVEITAPAQATAGQGSTLGVRVTNRGAGHSLPTGEVELRLMWLDVKVTDSTGRVVFSSGSVDEFGRPQEGTIAYGVTWADAGGAPTVRMWEAAAITSDRRIAAQASAHEQYSFAVPNGATGPLRVRVALMYQSKPAYLVRLMSTYSGQAIPQPAAIEMAVAESIITVSAAP